MTPKRRQIDYIEAASVAVIAAGLCCANWKSSSYRPANVNPRALSAGPQPCGPRVSMTVFLRVIIG